MKWIKISLKTTTEAVDYISSIFDDLGLEGIQIEDHIPISEEEKKAMFIDILPEPEPDDGTAVISSYVKPGFDIDRLTQQMKQELKEISSWVDIGEGVITVEEADDADWIDNWKEFFKPFRVTPNILIKPTWEPLVKEEEGLVIEIDPGTAFGTGSHETTKLCICALEKYVSKQTKLLDVGCGSGILSIIALKLGAVYTAGTDIDQSAIIASLENAQVNGLDPERYKIYTGDLIKDQELKDKIGYETYDIVTANILADVIIPLSAQIKPHMKKGGIFISSGIINIMRDEVEKALLNNGLKIIEVSEMGDWVSFVAQKEE